MIEPSRRLKGVLPGHTPPQPGELLSSWIIRLAIQNGLKAHSLCQLIWRDHPVWNRDIDNSAPTELLDAMSRATGQSVELVRDLTLSSYEGRVFERHNPTGYTRWLLPLGIYHRTRKRHGQQFCPSCLDEGVPYFRKAWRLAFVVACERHCAPLSDRCRCGAPVSFHRADIGRLDAVPTRSSFLCCFLCGEDLRASCGDPVDLAVLSAALEAQRTCNEALRSGYAEIPQGRMIASMLYFDGLHQLLRILVAARKANELRVTISDWRHGNGDDLEVGVSSVERIDAKNRLILMALVSEWLRGWPAAFVESCERTGLTASDIYRDMPQVPYWLASVVEESLNRSTYSPTLPEIRNAIAYLRRCELAVNKTNVSRLLGAHDAFRKRGLSYLLLDDSARD